MNLRKFIKRFLKFSAVAILSLTLLFAIALWICVLQANSRQHENRKSDRPQSGSFVAASDTELFVQQVGDPNLPAVVFVHGTGSWSETWRTAMVQTSKLGYRAVAIDLPPFGYSIPPPSGDYSKIAQAKRLLSTLDSLGIKQASFVSHSFGSAPVMEALITDPTRARSLVLVDAALGLDEPQTDGSDSTLQKILRVKWISQSISAAFLTNPRFTKTLLESFISEKEKATPDWIALYQRPLSLNDSYQQVALWLPELLSRRGQARSDGLEEYKKIQFPVTLIWGEADTITPLSQAIHLQTLLPNSRLFKIPKAGHIPQIEEQEIFLTTLTAALIQ